MLATRKELGELFADYDDERLLRILTVDRAMYRREALDAASEVLMWRGVAPAFIPAPAAHPPPPRGAARLSAKSRYQPVDLFADVALCGHLLWFMVWIECWEPLLGDALLDGTARSVLGGAVWFAAVWMRRLWRSRAWKD